ncbi:glycoside hydrolase family 130 protein [Pedobacter ureilyticus]|uniref:Glycoside hydrolase family 130 protein n=1 Tax=Pedobacter ureilyticus TaxID=1393051 RepID=A0ABW9JDQ1_9SPHI|nr:glycoside hydrolase family 130 protein [Pedobacter helvus]
MDIAKRFKENPLLKPQDLTPSAENLKVVCLLNPGVFNWQGKICLLVRVAENVAPEAGKLFIPMRSTSDLLEIMELKLDDPDLISTDPRVINYKGLDYLTTISYLRLFSSDDGINFKTEPLELHGKGYAERFGIEDCRVSRIDETFYLSYTAVSDNGVAVGLRTTKDWQNFENRGLIFPPHNKDVAIFEEKINGKFYALHRPTSKNIGGNYIWLAESPDGIHWGNHQCIVKTRANNWESARVGAGAAPIRTNLGWLEIYHGANADHRYCLGAVLLDLENPAKVLARTEEPIMEPKESYELSGFFSSVVFTNGHVVNGDELIVYYGAADEFICGAKFSIKEILKYLS